MRVLSAVVLLVCRRAQWNRTTHPRRAASGVRGYVKPEEQEDDSGERTMFVTRAQLFEAARLAAADPIANYLVVLEGTAQGRRLEIDAQPITVGRGATQTLVCDDRDVSRQHARVSVLNGAVVVE